MNLQSSIINDPGAAYISPSAGGSARVLDVRRWTRRIMGKERFQVLEAFNNLAVLDKETQLVWERSPRLQGGWYFVRQRCQESFSDARNGWRLPSLPELHSLVAPNELGAKLPAGHPFVNVATDAGGYYWSSTSAAGSESFAYTVRFSDGGIFLSDKRFFTTIRAWLVRSHQSDG